MATEALIQSTISTEPITQDRRSLRSRKMMREAFSTLVTERGLGGFTVGDLMERADLNRSTFYAHYSDLDTLLQNFEQEISDELEALKPRLLAVTLREMLAFERSGQPPKVTIELFEMLREHGSLLRVLLSPQGDAHFQAQLRDVVCVDMIRSVLHDKYTKDENALVDYYVSYYSAALLGLIQHWLANGMQEDSHQMARIMLSIMFLKPGDPIRLKGEKVSWG